MTILSGGRLTHAVKTAWVNMRADKFSTVIIVLSLALGVATSTFAFGVMETSRRDVLRTLPSKPDLVATFRMTSSDGDGFWRDLQPKDAQTWLNYLQAEGIKACSERNLWAGEKYSGAKAVSIQHAAVFDLQCSQGSLFAKQDFTSGAQVCILSWKACQDLKLGHQAIGQTLRMWGRDYRIIGVLARDNGARFNIIVPDPAAPAKGNWSPEVTVYARVEKRQQIDVLQRQWERFYTGIRGRYRIYREKSLQPKVVTLAQEGTGFVVRNIPTVLIGSILLIVACLNLVNITLAKAYKRRREIGVRKAAGATIGELGRQFVLESMLLCLGSGAIGFLLYLAALGVFHLFTGDTYGMHHQVVDLVTIAYALLVSALAGGLAAWIPAIRAARLDPILALRSDQQ